jgi:hypothetical protein
MHNITPNATHAIINARIAISAKDSIDPDHIADGLNELLRNSVDYGFMADYEFANSDQPAMVKSDSQPEEGDLFQSLHGYMICVQDSGYNEEWIKVETTKLLADMDESELRETLKNVIVIGEEDRVFVGNIQTSQRVIL